MGFLDRPDVPPKRTDRDTCPNCEATASGCRSNEWLRGRRCCLSCTGNHDGAGNRATS